MSSVIISGDTSGAITLSAPAVAGTNTLTLPATTATLATLTTPSFATTIGVGGATASASGSGITFPATANLSSNANTLDDYEEGTWTPVCVSGSGSIGSYSANGTYTKVGRIVTAYFTFNITTVGTASGGVDYSGLPFTTLDSNQNLGVLREVISSGAIYFINASGNNGSIQSSTGGGIAWSNGLSYRGIVTFQTAS